MKSLKKSLAISATTAVLLASVVGPVFAEDSATPTPTTSASTSPSPRKLIQEKFKESMQTLKETMRSTRNKEHATRLERNFGSYAVRLNNIAARIQSAIDKKTASGKATATAQAQLNTGKDTLAQAIKDGQTAVNMFNNISIAKWDVQNTEVKAAITQAQLARKEFAEARTQMVKAVSLLKSL